MATTWEEADARLIQMAKQVIDDYRPHLAGARIGFLFRSDPGSSQGKKTIGKATKVPARLQALLDLDFIIWISKPDWDSMEISQRVALLHHELCHCDVDLDTEDCRVVGHDIEEFNAVIDEHGIWRPSVEATARSIQKHLPGIKDVKGDGAVVALDPAKLTPEIIG